tara:strand:- start:1 stop:696 length:696 start_codon:yes stop_codon:yes gene_type:complete
MKTYKILMLLGIFFFMACESNDDSDSETLIFDYNFTTDREQWDGDFADYPLGEEEFFELIFEYSSLPAPLDQTNGALKISGNNHSDDLFMFVKRKITGLTPNKSYNIDFNIEFASNVADGEFGVGGSPGESVYIKAGATLQEPLKVLDDEEHYRLNIDKGNQAQGGSDMIVLGDFSNDTDQNIYTLKTLRNSSPFSAMSNMNGELWLIVGTDSGFESTTTIYFNKIEVTLK